jgi:hypothetical protein
MTQPKSCTIRLLSAGFAGSFKGLKHSIPFLAQPSRRVSFSDSVTTNYQLYSYYHTNC